MKYIRDISISVSDTDIAVRKNGDTIIAIRSYPVGSPYYIHKWIYGCGRSPSFDIDNSYECIIDGVDEVENCY
jgi:hypothetical protein